MTDANILQRIAELGDFRIVPSSEYKDMYEVWAAGSRWMVHTFTTDSLIDAYLGLRVEFELRSRMKYEAAQQRTITAGSKPPEDEL